MLKNLRRHRRKLIIIAVLLLTVGLLYGFRRPILIGIGNYLLIQDELHPGDLIAVMPADWQEAEYGIKLYKEGYAPKILFIGDDPTELAVSKSDLFQVVKKPWKEVAQGFALAQGVAEEALLLAGEQTSSTHKQVEQFVEVAQVYGFRAIIVVSDPLHLRRISWSASRLFRDEDVDLTYAPVPQEYYPPDSRFHPESWWRDEYSLKALFEEYVKLGFYLFNYR